MAAEKKREPITGEKKKIVSTRADECVSLGEPSSLDAQDRPSFISKITGAVRVAVVVAPNGKPKSIEVLGGNPLLAKSAVDAIQQWKWGRSALRRKPENS